MNQMKKTFCLTLAAAISLCTFVFPAAAAIITDNPHTGDTFGRYLPYVLGALGVSLVVILVIAITSSKKKK